VGVAIEVKDISKQFRLYNEKHTSFEGAGSPRRQNAVHPVLGAARRQPGHQPGGDLRHPRPQRVRQVDPAQVRAGILKPTSGEIRVRGSLAAMLELGAGFQPDLSGRDNIYLNGSLLGLSRSDIERAVR